MGIKGLTALIGRHAPEAVSHHPLIYFSGSVIAVDTSILLHKFMHNKHRRNDDNAHVNGFMNKALRYIKHGVIPVFVMDGKPPPEKSATIKRRVSHKQKLESRIKSLKARLEAGDESVIEQINKMVKQLVTVKKNHHSETADLLRIMGFTVITSPGEAEITCAELQHDKQVDFTYSDDTDVLPLGCKNVLRSVNGNNSIEKYDLDKVLKGLNLTLEQFVDLCILCGCDYCPPIPRMNNETAYHMIRKHGSIEAILDSETYTVSTKGFDYQSARKLFSGNRDVHKVKVTANVPRLDESGLRAFLSERSYSSRYIAKFISRFNTALSLFP